MKTLPSDPAYFLLHADFERPKKTVHRDGCYICEDPEFQQMGRPLCRPCARCEFEGHIPADDDCCDVCGETDRPDEH